MKKLKSVFSLSKDSTLPTSMPPCLRRPKQVLHLPKLSILSTSDSVARNPTSFTHHSDGSTSFSSSFSSSSFTHFPSNHVSNAPVKLVLVRSRFSWHEVLLAMSFGVPIALLSVTYEYVGDDLVPAKLFTSNPHLFYVFIILDALAFTASVIGFLLHSLHARTSKYLSIFAFGSLMTAFSVYMWVLLPSYLKWFPCLLLFMVTLALLYVNFGKSKKHYLDEYQIDIGRWCI